MKDFTALGAYIFAGGFTLGVSKHLRVLGHLEEGDFGVATSRLNFPELPIWVGEETWPLLDLRAEGVDLLYANPPCSAFSSARYGNRSNGAQRWQDHPTIHCIPRTMDIARQIEPQVVVWESVTGAWTRGREMLDEFAEEFTGRGYAVTHMLTDGLAHGMAQRRRRYLFWAHRVELDFGEPRIEWRTAREALAGITPDWTERVSEMTAKLWAKAEPGGTPRDTITQAEREELKAMGVTGLPSFTKKRLDPDAPAPTVAGIARHMHWDEPRNLSNAEHAALCGYPPTFRFACSPSQVQREMARAVLPPVGEYVGRVVRAGLEAREPAKPSVRIVDHLTPAEELMKRKREALKVKRSVDTERERYDWTFRDLLEDPPKPPASPRG